MLNKKSVKLILATCRLFFCLILTNCSETESRNNINAPNHLLQKIRQAQSSREYAKALSLITYEEKNNPEITAEIYFLKGNIYASLNSFDKASVAYTQALRIDSNHSHSLNNLSLLLADQGRIQDAIDLLSEHKDDPAALLNIALFQIKIGKYNQAEKMLREAKSLQPKNPTIYQHIGSLLLKQGRHNRAERAILKAWDLDSTHVESARLMGLLYRDKGDLNRAIFFFKRALLINPNHLDSNYNLAMTLAKAGLITDSEIFMSKFERLSVRTARIAQIRRLLDEQPNSTTLRLELAGHYIHLDKIGEAESQYHTILALDSLQIESLVNLTKISIQQNRLNHARKFSERGIRNFSNKREAAPLYASLGYLHLIKGDHIIAEELILKAVSFDSTLSDAWNNLGNLFQQKNELNIAKNYFEKALSIDSLNSLAAYNLGVIYYQSDSIMLAESHFHKALRADSTYWRAKLALGEIYEKMDSIRVAIIFYNSAQKDLTIDSVMKNYAQERISYIKSDILQ